MSNPADKPRPFSRSISASGIELTPKQQSDQDLLDQSGMGGLFFTIGAAALTIVEPLIWQKPLVAVVFLSLMGVLMLIRLYLYFTLPAMTGFVLPKLYYTSVLGNAAVWGVYAAWIVSLPHELSTGGVIVFALSAGAASGGSVSTAMDLRLTRALLMCYHLPLIIFLLWNFSNPQLLTLGLLLILYWVYLYLLSNKQHQAYWNVVNTTEKLRKQTQELAEARNEALKANQIRAAFLAHISHEIRAPINGIIGMAGDLVVSPLDDGQRDQVNVILQSGKLALGLINDVMDFSDINHDAVLIGQVDVDLLDVGNDTINVLEPAVRPRGNRIELIDKLQGKTWVKVDRLRLQQLLINLLANANKFTLNGRIQLHMYYMPGSRPEQDLIRFEVHDEGPLITAAQQKQLLEAYQQTGRSDPSSRGAGLGLAICSRLIKLLGGRLGIKSDLQHGSCFWFEIPLVPGVPVAKVSPALYKTDNHRPALVLVVEDNLMSQKVVMAYLNKLQYPFVNAESGQQAFDACIQRRPTHILMDCGLPDISGMEVTRRIRKMEQEQTLPPCIIIAVTAYGAGNIVDECFAAGMNDHLPKPVTLRTLQGMLDKWG